MKARFTVALRVCMSLPAVEGRERVKIMLSLPPGARLFGVGRAAVLMTGPEYRVLWVPSQV